MVPGTVGGSSSKRFVVLDGLRGVAALLVVLFHAERDGSPFYKLDPLFLMVDFFFVLSGFVLAPGLPSKVSSFGRDAASFVIRRVSRLWPVALVAIVLSTAVYEFSIWYTHSTGAGFDYDVTRTTKNYLAAALLMQIWISKSMMMVVPLWSLSAEWFVNLIYLPLSLLKRIAGPIVGIGLGYALLWNGLANDHEWISWIGPIRGHEALGRALIGFGLGMLTRSLFDALAGKFRWWLINFPLFALSLWLVWWLFGSYRDYGYTVLYWAGAIFALVVLQGAGISVSQDSIPGRIMLRLGVLSFGIYAFHRTIMDAFNRLTAEPLHWYSTPIYMAPNSVWMRFLEFKFIVVAVLSAGLAAVVNRWIERPIQGRGRFFAKSIQQSGPNSP